jgi:formate dehydrogenase assembly factor FdhD
MDAWLSRAQEALAEAGGVDPSAFELDAEAKAQAITLCGFVRENRVNVSSGPGVTETTRP